MAEVDFTRILSTLNNAQIQTKQPAIYQAIKDIITSAKQNQTNVNKTFGTLNTALGNTFTWGTAADKANYKPKVTIGNLVFFYETDTGRLYLFQNNSWEPIGAPIDATYLTSTDESARLPNSRQLLAGSGITFDDSIPNERTVSANGFSWAFITVNNADFLTLPTTFIDVVPAPGANKVLVPLWAYINVDAAAGAYGNVDPPTTSGLTVAYGDWNIDCFNFMWGWAGLSEAQFLYPIHRIPDATTLFNGYADRSEVYLAVNYPMKLISWNVGGDYTGGNAANSVTVGVAYLTLDVVTGLFS